MLPDWESSGGVKIERADQHIRDLDARIQAFNGRDPYPIITEPDGEPWGIRYLVQTREDVPAIWSGIAGDAIHNLWSTLDALWHRVAVLQDPKGARTKGRKGIPYRNFFPLYVSADKLKSGLERTKECPLKTAMQVIEPFNPYHEGDYPLHWLRAAEMADKHEAPSLVGHGDRIIEWAASVGNPRVVLWTNSDKLSALPTSKDGAVLLARATVGRTPVDVEYQLSHEITFAEGGPLQGKAVIPTLHEFAGIVDAIVEAFRRDNLLRQLP